MSSSERKRVLVTRALFPEHLARLAGRFEVEANQEDLAWDAQELARRLVGKDGALITGGDRIDRGLIAQVPGLGAVCSISVGYNHVDLAACTAGGVMVTNTPDVLTETTADLGWALMMAAARHVTQSERWLRAGHWQRWALDQWLGQDVHHSTLGIIGMGRIGQAIARRASGFSMRVIYHNRTRVAPEAERALGATYVERQTLFATADHVILVLPYSAENHHMVGARELAWMQPHATLTNIARGGLIDEHALSEALAQGRLGAAALDVFEGEPRVAPELLALSNVALTPHIGSASRATRNAMANLAIDNLCAALSGTRPPCLLNPEVLERRA